MGCSHICRRIKEWNKLLIVFILPLVLLPIIIGNESPVARCAYAVVIVGTFWVVEALPIAVTSLIPVFLFPLLGIMPSDEVCANYANDTLMLFFGSLVVAAAVERWNLHKRIALRALTLVGPEPRWLMLGIMLPTWFLSMWMSNTATTAMMIPILNAILSQIKAVMDKVHDDEDENSEKCRLNSLENGGDIPNGTVDVKVFIEMDDILEPGHPVTLPVPNRPPLHLENSVMSEKKRQREKEFKALCKTFALCTAYASNSGGVATLTGTPPNIILKGQADILYANHGLPSSITFANWLVLGIPLSLAVFLFSWVWLQIYSLGKKCLCCIKNDDDFSQVKAHLKHEYKKLGPMSFAEKIVLTIFVFLALLWVMRNPVIVPGWGMLFQKGFVKDSTAAMFIATLLFVLPSEFPNFRKPISSGQSDLLTGKKEYIPLLTWKYANDKMAWGVILLMGGGFALADGCAKSGLSEWMSTKLTLFGGLPPWVISMILAYITAAITNITSNAATATLFLPIVGSLAIQLEIHPLYFMIPCALASSFAYLLPVGTPPNAIVFSTGYLKISDMFKAGLVVNFGSVLLLVVFTNLVAFPVFDLGNIPIEFLNSTHGIHKIAVLANDTLGYNITSGP